MIESINDITEDNILSDEVYEWLFSIEPYLKREKTIYQVQQLAEKFGKKKLFNKFLSAARKDYTQYSRDMSKVERSETYEGDLQDFFEPGEEEKYPPLHTGSWICNQNGIKTYDGTKGELVACGHPVTIVSILQNAQTQLERVRIAFKNHSGWKEITPLKSIIASASKIVTLADSGLAVTSENSRMLVRYFSDLEMINHDSIPVKVSSSKLGWLTFKNKLIFVPYDKEISFDGEESFRQVFNSVGTSGSRKEYYDLLYEVRNGDRIEPRIVLAASIASVLLGFCNVLPFMVNLYGQTEGGKTLCMMLAASVWANPEVGAGYIGDFKTTPVALEVRANLLNDLPLILDDSSEVSKRLRDDFSETIYTLCNGTGKDRSDQNLGIRAMNSWKNIIICSGEHPIVRDIEQGGAANRVFSVEAEEGKMFSDGHKVAETLKKNYGFLGKEFIGLIASGFISVDKIKECELQIENKLREINPDWLHKQVAAASIILTADLFATEYIFKDERELHIDDIADFIKTVNDISENVKCLEYLREVFVSNRGLFYDGDAPSDDNSGENSFNMLGFYEKDQEDHTIVYFFSTKFDEILEQKGFSPKMFLKWASRKDGLTSCTKGKLRLRKRWGNERVRVVPIDVNWGIEEEEPEPVSENDDDVPF